jgi:hypothetical protein
VVEQHQTLTRRDLASANEKLRQKIDDFQCASSSAKSMSDKWKSRLLDVKALTPGGAGKKPARAAVRPSVTKIFGDEARKQRTEGQRGVSLGPETSELLEGLVKQREREGSSRVTKSAPMIYRSLQNTFRTWTREDTLARRKAGKHHTSGHAIQQEHSTSSSSVGFSSGSSAPTIDHRSKRRRPRTGMYAFVTATSPGKTRVLHEEAVVPSLEQVHEIRRRRQQLQLRFRQDGASRARPLTAPLKYGAPLGRQTPSRADRGKVIERVEGGPGVYEREAEAGDRHSPARRRASPLR